MTSLLQLPPELLTLIFFHVGSAYFRADLSRLTVSKEWNIFAQEAYFRDISLSEKTLHQLISSSYAETSTRSITSNVQTMELQLRGFEKWDFDDISSVSFIASRTSWIKDLDKDILSLVTSVETARKLHSIRIKAAAQIRPSSPFMQRRNYLHLPTLQAIISPTNLTSLEIDLCGTERIQQDTRGEGPHLCTSIAEHLPTLRRLRLRLRHICPDVLKVGDQGKKLQLNDLIINMSLLDDSSFITSALHSTRCSATTLGGSLQLIADMKAGAEALVDHMEEPKVVRVMTHTPVRNDIRAFDALSGDDIQLSKGAAWDAEGTVIVPLLPPPSEISDLSSDED